MLGSNQMHLEMVLTNKQRQSFAFIIVIAINFIGDESDESEDESDDDDVVEEGMGNRPAARRNRPDGKLVVLEFNATLTAKVISWRSVTHMCFLAFSHQY